MSLTRISEIMSGNVIDIQEDASIAETINLYITHKISGVPVKNANGDYVAVISKTDLVTPKLVDCIQSGRNLSEVKVKELMSSRPPLSIHADKPIDDAIAIMMDNKIHRLFVVDDEGKLIGVVSTFDIVKAARFTFESYL